MSSELRFCILIAFIGVALGASLMGIAFQFTHNQTQTQTQTKKEVSTKQNITEQVITETDLYRMICTEVKDNVCMACAVKRIVKE